MLKIFELFKYLLKQPAFPLSDGVSTIHQLHNQSFFLSFFCQYLELLHLAEAFEPPHYFRCFLFDSPAWNWNICGSLRISSCRQQRLDTCYDRFEELHLPPTLCHPLASVESLIVSLAACRIPKWSQKQVPGDGVGKDMINTCNSCRAEGITMVSPPNSTIIDCRQEFDIAQHHLEHLAGVDSIWSDVFSPVV